MKDEMKLDDLLKKVTKLCAAASQAGYGHLAVMAAAEGAVQGRTYSWQVKIPKGLPNEVVGAMADHFGVDVIIDGDTYEQLMVPRASDDPLPDNDAVKKYLNDALRRARFEIHNGGKDDAAEKQ